MIADVSLGSFSVFRGLTRRLFHFRSSFRGDIQFIRITAIFDLPLSARMLGSIALYLYTSFGNVSQHIT